MSNYTSIKLATRPQPGPLTNNIFEVCNQPIPHIEEGQILIKQTHMSLDPAMFGWMNDDPESYIPPVAIGEVMRSSGVGVIEASNHSDFAVGDMVRGMTGWSEYIVSNGSGFSKLQPGLDAETVLAVFALPGLTATQGLYGFTQPKAGQTLVVSGAAGSVGSLVGQLGKADGLNVIGVAGNNEKCAWITQELGFDGAINYKTDDIGTRLTDLAPDGIDMYFENTGGAIQDHIFEHMNAHGTIIVCGMIADYANAEPSPGPNWIPIIKKRLTIQGFAMPDHYGEVPQLLEKLTPYVLGGKIKFRTHILEGLESAVDGLNMFLDGSNQGKLIVKL